MCSCAPDVLFESHDIAQPRHSGWLSPRAMAGPLHRGSSGTPRNSLPTGAALWSRALWQGEVGRHCRAKSLSPMVSRALGGGRDGA
eukprot:10958286-Alexandrium_andersonii.AAC.2